MLHGRRKATNSGPVPAGSADLSWSMSARRTAASRPPGPLAEAGPEERLARWDELAPLELASLERDPRLGPQLELLREVDALLQRSLPPEAPCPPAGDLYDYAGGPGAGPLDRVRRSAVTAHLELCTVCAGQVQSLSLAAPPPPLLLEPQRLGQRREPVALRVARWMPMTAAAALLMLAFLVFKGPGAQPAAWPTQPLLRGEHAGGPLFPRGAVLASGAGAALSFEVAVVAGATRYRVVVSRHAGDAFARGAEVLRLEGDAPTLTAGSALDAGSYTTEAWAVVDGLERYLGARDFVVVADAELAAQAAQLEGVARVRTLHAAGFWTDARRAARALPASQGRDAYLGALPGR